MEIKAFFNDNWFKYRELFLYAIIGSLSAGLDFGVYTILCYIDLNYIISNIFSVNVGICTSFIFNRSFTFRVKDKTKKRFATFYLIGLFGLLLSTGMLYLLVDFADISKGYSKIVTIIVVAFIQFMLNKFITFKK